MQRFFVEKHQIDETGKTIRLTGGDYNHMKNVLRMKPGEEVWISDGDSLEYYCSVASYGENEAVLHIYYAQETQYELPGQIFLFQGLPKGDKMELIIQKAVELGAYAIIPVEMKRCVVKLDDKKADKKIARWQQIAESAAKQSKRMIIPEVRPVMKLPQALEAAGKLDVCFLPYECAEGMQKTRELITSVKPGQRVGIFIGPEGGFEEAEVALAQELANAQILSLGKRILRTETAGMTMLSVLMMHLEFCGCK
ncbi:MAG: 16S rRNA (uracil(1498)-N(3))-methyltransferase [Blautia sp.]|nr:16S rRNA (uracil(1498)-N(3))-methyltransferase [Blautia sp.]